MTGKTKDKTAKQRVARHVERMGKAGFVRVHPWVHKDDLYLIKAYAERLRKRRLKGLTP